MDEAEYALVAARGDLRRSGRLQLEAEAGPPPRQHRAPLDAAALHREAQALLPALEVEVDDVAQGAAVDGEDPVAGEKTGPGGRRAGGHGGHHDARRFLRGPAGHVM